MTIPRLVGLLTLFAMVGMAAVLLRADQTRISHRIQQLRLEQIRRQCTIRANEMSIARLKSPPMVRDRTRRFDVPMVPPYEPKGVLPPDEAWVADQ